MDDYVSIPRSGFCFVERAGAEQAVEKELRFQSLGRDSVLSNLIDYKKEIEMKVSIPRSGFCFVERYNPSMGLTKVGSFQSLGRDSVLSN